MRKILVRIFNLVFLAFAAISIIFYFTKPIVDISVEIPMPTQLIYDTIKGNEKDETPTKLLKEKEDSGEDPEDILKNVTKEDLDECLGDKKFTINLSIPLSIAEDLKDAESCKSFLLSTINQLVDDNIEDLTNGLKQLIKKVGGKIASSTISDNIKAQMESIIGSGEEAQQQFEELGIAEDVDEIVNEIFEMMDSEEGTTVDELGDVIAEKATEIANKLANNGYEEFEGADAFNTTEIKQEMEKELKEAGLVDENGKILNMDEALAMLLDLIPISEEETPASEENTASHFRSIRLSTEPEDEEDLDAKVKNLISSLIDKIDLESENLQTVYKIAGDYGKYIPLLSVVMAAPWALFALVTIIRTIRRRKCWTKPWIVFFFAFLQLILGVGIYAATKFALPAISDTLVSNTSAGGIGEIISGGTLLIKTGCFVSSILYLVMIPLTIAYMIVAHKVKKEFKQYKKEKKLAKKAA